MKNGYLDFDEYIRQGEPQQKERAEAWRVAIGFEPRFLISFFRNLLLGENNILKNKYMLINSIDSFDIPEQVPEQDVDLLHTDNVLVINLLKIIGCKEYSISQLMEKVGLKHRPNFIEYHLNPAISEGYIRLLYPDKPRHPRQKYLLTIKGLTLYNELIKNNNN